MQWFNTRTGRWVTYGTGGALTLALSVGTSAWITEATSEPTTTSAQQSTGEKVKQTAAKGKLPEQKDALATAAEKAQREYQKQVAKAYKEQTAALKKATEQARKQRLSVPSAASYTPPAYTPPTLPAAPPAYKPPQMSIPAGELDLQQLPQQKMKLPKLPEVPQYDAAAADDTENLVPLPKVVDGAVDGIELPGMDQLPRLDALPGLDGFEGVGDFEDAAEQMQRELDEAIDDGWSDLEGTRERTAKYFDADGVRVTKSKSTDGGESAALKRATQATKDATAAAKEATKAAKEATKAAQQATAAANAKSTAPSSGQQVVVQGAQGGQQVQQTQAGGSDVVSNVIRSGTNALTSGAKAVTSGASAVTHGVNAYNQAQTGNIPGAISSGVEAVKSGTTTARHVANAITSGADTVDSVVQVVEPFTDAASSVDQAAKAVNATHSYYAAPR